MSKNNEDWVKSAPEGKKHDVAPPLGLITRPGITLP